MNKTKILIADDHQLFRNGLKSLLGEDEYTIVGEASNIEELMWLVKSEEADVLLLDISMHDKSGLDMIEKIKFLKPGLKCIMLTMHEEAQYVMQSLKKGADGYLLKDSSERELKEAIGEVLRDNKYYKNKVSEIIVSRLGLPDGHNKLLTDREIQIVKLVAEGRITKEIADALSVSVRTIETHRSKIMKKLGVANTAEMIRSAYEKKIV